MFDMDQPQQIQMTLQEALDKMLLFVRQHPGVTYSQWPLPSLVQWLLFLHSHGSLQTVWGPGPGGHELLALFAGWRMRKRDWQHPQFLAAPWNFAIPAVDGDGFYLDMILARPGAIPVLAANIQWHNPDWRKLVYAGKRHGKLKEWRSPEQFAANLERL